MQIKKFLIGMIIGVGLIVPGVSFTATIVALNFYDEYLELLKKFYSFKVIKKNIFLIIGLTFGIILTGIFIKNMIKTNVVLLNGIFLGMMINIVSKTKIKKDNILKIIFGIVVIIGVKVILENISIINSNYLTLLVAGYLTSLAFFVPGLSGGLILLSFNLYYKFINIFNELLVFNFSNFNIILLFILFLVSSIYLNFKMLKINVNSSFIIGFIIGSCIIMFYDHYLLINDYYSLIKYITGFIIGFIILKMI